MGLHASAVVSFENDLDKESEYYKAYENLSLKVESLRKTSAGVYVPNDVFLPNETPYLRVYTGSDIEIAHIETVFGSDVKKVSEGVQQVLHSLEFNMTQHEADMLMKKGENPINVASIPDIVTGYRVVSAFKNIGQVVKTGISEFTASKFGWGYAEIEYSTDVLYFAVYPSKVAKEKSFTEQIKLFGRLREGLIDDNDVYA